MRRASSDLVVALVVSGLVVAEMAVDHLIGTDEEPGEAGGLADPTAFVFGVVVSLALVAVLFGAVVPRVRSDLERAAKYAIATSALAVPALALLFLGLPLPLAAAGIAFGLHGRAGGRRGLATAAVALGAAVIGLTVVGYLVALVG